MPVNFNGDYTMTIDGKAVSAASSFEVFNPATEEVIAKAPDASREQLEAAVSAAKAAFPAWSARPLSERQAFVARLGDAIEAHAEEFMRLLTREQGKAFKGAEWEVGGSAFWCREIAKQELPLHVAEKTDGRTVETRRVPLGVVGGITPWNFPILLAVWKIAPALVAGNTMVLKPSPYTPLCTLKLGEIVRDILPPGVLNVVSGGNDLGSWLTQHKDISKISFTGSTATGRKIMEACSGNLKRITLELGGNDPAIVLPDVNVKETAEKLFWAAFQNSAQFCVAAKRLYIHEDIYDELAEALVAYARTVKVGDGAEQGTDLGPIQNRMQFEKLKNLLADAKDKGLHFLLGGEVEDRKGFFVPVTIIDNPPEDSRVVVEEAFGPVLPLLKFKNIDDVIHRANNTEYGLAASVWGKDIAAARGIAERIEAGTVWVNEIHSFSPHVAFGGHKQSGIGIENALEGLSEYTNSQTLVINAAA
ncbi:aldehyde dehydrogenase family protein [Agrobacterium vitis]|uniref:aldehyde dehydrogenase family protein n=1 Tax=Agrobacterium vitis TaxID=373 RepID=UPI0015735045|nr:aldehyde dehydrogenase family protein [Agrobacterium vitis]NSZ20247.1 aldehyde dehydrogenase family protein [Agrobacterium vitis]QZO07366.1 aldehyde dehydrogenase family protein [Agrobacterium vitis]UJL90859.1 aldehyde dehydrogenase family protein [Agrobacterium vitis]